MADKEHYTLDQVLAAIKGSSGIKENIRKRLDCSRSTVDNYLKRYATAQQAYDDEVQINADVAETVVILDFKVNRNVETAKWYLANKAKDRGYGKSGEHGNEDGEIVIRVLYGAGAPIANGNKGNNSSSTQSTSKAG